MFEDCIPIKSLNDMTDFIETLDYSAIEEATTYQAPPDTKWRVVACLGVDVYVFHHIDVPIGGVSDFFDLECGEEGADYGDENDDEGSYNASGSYKNIIKLIFRCFSNPEYAVIL